MNRRLIEASRSSKTYYDQYTTHHTYICIYDSSHRSDSINNEDYQSQRCIDPYIYNHGYRRDSSQSASRFLRYERKVPVDSLNNSRNSLIDHALPVVFDLKIDIHDGAMNIHVLIYPYTTCHVFDVAADIIHLQTVNIPHH